MVGALGCRAGCPDLSRPGVYRRLQIGGRSGARVHSLSTAETPAAKAGARPRHDRRLRRLNRARGQPVTWSRAAEAFFRSRAPADASLEILCDGFGGKISPPGRAIPGQSDRRCRARGTKRIAPITTKDTKYHEGYRLSFLRGTLCPLWLLPSLTISI